MSEKPGTPPPLYHEGLRRRSSLRVFLQRFFRDPRSVGAVAPSSRFLARKMVEPIRWRAGVKIVEFGPGTGPFTDEIARRLPAGAQYLGIERDPVFAELLRRRFPHLDFVCESVEGLVGILEERDLLPVDHIISGLPFASLPVEVSSRILDAIEGALANGATFTTFQYLHAYGLPAARRFRREMRRRLGALRSARLEFRNLPPAFVFTWRKGES